MSVYRVPLARLSLVYSRSEDRRVHGGSRLLGRFILWGGGFALAALLYFGVPAFWNWKHAVGSSGGRYFVHRVAIAVPPFRQGDPRWTFDLLGPTYDTLGQSGCAITSAAMVLASYGVDTDPKRLNEYLTTNGGYTEQGWVYWEKAAEVAPYSQVEKAYEDLPSYALIDQNLLAGNPVIIRLVLPNGHTHFVVIVGKDGWDYLTQDPAQSYSAGAYPLRYLTARIEALRFYRVVPPVFPPPAPLAPLTPALVGSAPVTQTAPPANGATAAAH